MILKHINKTYGDKFVIKDFSIDITDMGITGFFGRSGCGKTTLLNIISGIIKDFTGEMTHSAKNISFVFQENRLLPWINVLNNVIIVIKSKKDNSEYEDRAKYLLERLGLANDIYKYSGELSGGMMQRVNIARALMYDFDMLIMDEPFKGIDAAMKEKVMELIKEELGQRPALFISHDVSEMLKMCEEVFIMDGTPIKVIKHLKLQTDKELLYDKLLEKYGGCFSGYEDSPEE